MNLPLLAVTMFFPRLSVRFSGSRIPNLGQTCLQFTFYFYFQAKRMDVVWGETAGVDGQLWLLCPILFILQVI